MTVATTGWCGEPIRVHPKNPRYFEWRGKPLLLISSGEHYGAVLNLDFDDRRYLDAMQRAGMNYTRVFTGAYVEPAGAVGITRNNLAPVRGRFLAPGPGATCPGTRWAGTSSTSTAGTRLPRAAQGLSLRGRRTGHRGRVDTLLLHLRR